MIFITAAMVSEARPIIDRFSLKINGSENRFRIYENESIKLIITGVGATKAMIATVYLLTRYGAKKTDCLLNLGIAAIYSLEQAAETEKCKGTIKPGLVNQENKTVTIENALEFIEEEKKSFYGSIYLASSIENSILKRSFYPDMLLVTPFAQTKVVTVGEVYIINKSINNIHNTEDRCETDKEKTKHDIKSDITSDINNNNKISKINIRNNLNIVSGDATGLIDVEKETLSSRYHHNIEYSDKYTSSVALVEMEAAFIYEAAIGYIYSHNIFVLKIVSDSGDPQGLTPVKVTSLIDLNMEKIETFVNLLIEWSRVNLKPETITESDRKVVEEISNSLRLTQYQRIELLNLSEMYVIRSKNLKAALGSFVGISPIKQKREGKESYEKIRRILLQP